MLSSGLVWKRLVPWIPEILLVSVTTIAGFAAGGRWVDPVGDPGTWWSMIYRLADGQVLYRDVFIQFGPLSPYLLALGAKGLGASVAFIRVATWLPAIGASMLLLYAARKVLNTFERIALVGLLLSISVLAPGAARLVFPYAPGAVHALVFSVIALGLLGSERPVFSVRAWSAGVLAGAALLAKQEIGVACIASLVIAGVVGPGFRWVRRCLAGFSLVGLGGVLVALSSASLESLREQSRIWPIALTPPETWRTLYRSVAGLSSPDSFLIVRISVWQLAWYVTLFALFGLACSRQRRLSVWLPTTLLLAIVLVWRIVEGFSVGDPLRPVSLSMLVALAVAAYGLAMPGLARRETLIAFGLFAGLTATRVAFSPDLSGPYVGVARFASCFTWIVFLCRLVPGMLLADERARLWSRRIATTLILVVGAAGTGKGIASLGEPGKEAVRTRQGEVFVSPEMATFFSSIGQRVSAGKKIWVLPEINGVDALFQATSTSPYPSHSPGWLDERAERELLRRIEQDPPDIVVIFRRPTREYGVAPFGAGYDRLIAAWIARKYVPLETTDAGTILAPAFDGGVRSRATSRIDIQRPSGHATGTR
jgi:hypothetical protein